MHLSDKYPFLTNYFEKVLTSETKPFPQAILFYGNNVPEQYEIVTELARVLNCKEGQADDCECLNCRWVKNYSHPAVITVSRLDNKPVGDDTKTNISVKQADFIKENLLNMSDSHRVFIFCNREDDGTISGLNSKNFPDTTANALLKSIEEPQPNVTFIFLARFMDDILSTIKSRCECFYVPAKMEITYDYSIIKGVFENYWEFDRKEVFNISQKLLDLTKNNDTTEILTGMQNYMLNLFKSNPKQSVFLEHIKLVEDGIKQAKLGIKPVNIFDDLCLRILK